MNGALWTFFIVGGKLKPSLSSCFWNPLYERWRSPERPEIQNRSLFN